MVVGEVADAALDVDAGVCSRTAAAFSSHSVRARESTTGEVGRRLGVRFGRREGGEGGGRGEVGCAWEGSYGSPVCCIFGTSLAH